MKTVLRYSAQIAGLWAIAIAQPLFDVIGRAPEFLVAHRVDARGTAIMAALIVFGGPLVLALVLGAAHLIHRRLGAGIAAACVGGLGGMIAIQAGYRVGASGWIPALVVGLAAASALTIAWLRWSGLRAFLMMLSPAALLVPLIFLLTGPLRPVSAQAETMSSTRTASATPVAIVVFDELSLVSLLGDDGRINAARYPNLAALAAEGVWFRNATAVSDYTRWALPAILTGRYPTASSTPTPRDHPNTLFSLVSRTHRLEVLEPVTAICPGGLCVEGDDRVASRVNLAADLQVIAAHVFFPPDARANLPDLTEDWAGFGAEDEDADEASPAAPRVATRSWQNVWRRSAGADHLATARKFIDGITPDDRQPTLYFIHTLASHHPNRWMPGGQRIADRRPMPGMSDGRWTNEAWIVAQNHHGHLLQAGLADWLVGQLRSRLTAAGVYDRSMIVVTADHGASFTPGDKMRAFTGDNASALAAVPLIMKLPAGAAGPRPGTIDDSNAETIDVVPTLAQVLGTEVRWPIDGRSLLDGSAVRPEKLFFFNLATMHETYGPGELSHRRDEAVRRQTALFGSERWPAFTLPELTSLVGRDLASIEIAGLSDDVRLSVDNPAALDDFDPNAGELPVQLSGRVRADDAASARTRIAVALNGRIVATTRAWPRDARWVAMLPPDALRAGANDVEALVVDAIRPDRLRRWRPRTAAAGINLIYADSADTGIVASGFHRGQQDNGVDFRWTDGYATVQVPIDPSRPPSALVVDVLRSASPAGKVVVRVDGCDALAESNGASRWSRTISLDRCAPKGYWATIQIESDTGQAEGDRRRLGVAVVNLALKQN